MNREEKIKLKMKKTESELEHYRPELAYDHFGKKLSQMDTVNFAGSSTYDSVVNTKIVYIVNSEIVIIGHNQGIFPHQDPHLVHEKIDKKIPFPVIRVNPKSLIKI
jgi:hypothetical protein